MINSSSSTDRPSKTAVLYTKVRRGPTLGLVTLGLGRPRLFFSDRPVLARGKTCILLVCVCNKKIWLVNRARHLESADRKLKIDGRAATQCTATTTAYYRKSKRVIDERDSSKVNSPPSVAKVWFLAEQK